MYISNEFVRDFVCSESKLFKIIFRPPLFLAIVLCSVRKIFSKFNPNHPGFSDSQSHHTIIQNTKFTKARTLICINRVIHVSCSRKKRASFKNKQNFI